MRLGGWTSLGDVALDMHENDGSNLKCKAKNATELMIVCLMQTHRIDS